MAKLYFKKPEDVFVKGKELKKLKLKNLLFKISLGLNALLIIILIIRCV